MKGLRRHLSDVNREAVCIVRPQEEAEAAAKT